MPFGRRVRATTTRRRPGRFSMLLLALTGVAATVGYWMWGGSGIARIGQTTSQPDASGIQNGSAERERSESSSIVPGSPTIAVRNRDWPALFGPTNDSRVAGPETNLELDWSDEGPPAKWRKPVGTGYSSPIVCDGKLILLSRIGDEEILECRNAETGESLWEFRGPTTFQNGYDRYSSGPYSTPVADGERVYAVGAEGRFHCVDLQSGEPLWSRFLTEEYDVPEGAWPVSGSPLLEGDLLIVNLGGRDQGAGILALKKVTGETAWTATDHGAGLATPRAAEIHGSRYVFVLTLDGLVCLSPATGDVHWIEEFGANHPEKINSTSPLIWGDRVLISAFAKGSLCLRVLPDGGREKVWETRRELQVQYSPLIGWDGYVYAFHSRNKTLRCVDLRDGEIQWEWPEPGQDGVSRGTAIAIGDRLVLLGEYGYLAALDANPKAPVLRSLTAQPVLKPDCFSSPALANGLMYLRNEQEVVCFDLRAEQGASAASAADSDR